MILLLYPQLLISDCQPDQKLSCHCERPWKIKVSINNVTLNLLTKVNNNVKVNLGITTYDILKGLKRVCIIQQSED